MLIGDLLEPQVTDGRQHIVKKNPSLGRSEILGPVSAASLCNIRKSLDFPNFLIYWELGNWDVYSLRFILNELWSRQVAELVCAANPLVTSSSFLNSVNQCNSKFSKVIPVSLNTLPWRICFLLSYFSELFLIKLPFWKTSAFPYNYLFCPAISYVYELKKVELGSAQTLSCHFPRAVVYIFLKSWNRNVKSISKIGKH